jgi:hypothetical protein
LVVPIRGTGDTNGGVKMNEATLRAKLGRIAGPNFWLAVRRNGGRWINCLGVVALSGATIVVTRPDHAGPRVERYWLNEIIACAATPP